MTWSPNQPRGVPRTGQSPSPAPVSWAPAELALDTSSLYAALGHRDETNAEPNEPAAADPLEMARALEEAFARGYEEGRQAGEAAEATRLRTAVAATSDALNCLNQESDRWLGNIEENVAALATAIARHIIGQEIAADKSSMSEMVRLALTEFPIDQPVVVRVNPLDLRAITEVLSSDESPATSPRAEMQYISDSRIAPGGCLIEGRDRIVDGRVDTALERLYRRLTYTGA